MSLLTALLAAAACGSDGSWREGSTHGAWRVVYDGGGYTGPSAADETVIRIRPQPPADKTKTHAGLIVSRAEAADSDVRMRVRTTARTRNPPNVWEVAWAVWRYADPQHFYYLLLKPNGWELGKADPAYTGAQRFLATGDTAFPVGAWYDVRVLHSGDRIQAWVGGKALVDHTDTERPYARGNVGLYAEDAEAEFAGVTLNGTALTP
jgi:3-keto-disaccharide hydrolase